MFSSAPRQVAVLAVILYTATTHASTRRHDRNEQRQTVRVHRRQRPGKVERARRRRGYGRDHAQHARILPTRGRRNARLLLEKNLQRELLRATVLEESRRNVQVNVEARRDLLRRARFVAGPLERFGAPALDPLDLGPFPRSGFSRSHRKLPSTTCTFVKTGSPDVPLPGD